MVQIKLLFEETAASMKIMAERARRFTGSVW
jgi:hypothetical protein